MMKRVASTLKMPETAPTIIQNLFESLLAKIQAWKPVVAQYKDHPQRFFEERGVIFHPEFQKIWDDLYGGKISKAVAVAPRGSGKSLGAAALGTAFFLFKGYDVGIVAGSETQALNEYAYMANWLGEPEIIPEYLAEEPRRSYLIGIWGNRIVARTASPKSIRGLHLGQGKRGAILIIDEEAECEEDVVRAALYITRTAKPAIILRQSTYHHLQGTFAELVDLHEEKGYKKYHWDTFDIAEPCPYPCNQCPRQDFVENYCKGKAKKTRGWIPIDQIVSEYDDAPKEWFEVEDMGLRPSAAGLVLNPDDIVRALKPGKQIKFVAGVPIWAGLDWGFAGMTVILLFQQLGDRIQIIKAEMFTRHAVDAIILELKNWRSQYGLREIFPDSSHPFENQRLVDEGFILPQTTTGKGETNYGVSFATFKEEGAGILQFLFEKRLIDIVNE